MHKSKPDIYNLYLNPDGTFKLGPFAPRDVVSISIENPKDEEISPTERAITHPKKVEVKLCKDSNSVDKNGSCIDTCHQSWCKGSCTANCQVSKSNYN